MLRVSEIYASVQGEGPSAGEPTLFVRFAGCNMRCEGWPCDTPHAIFPHLWRKESTKDSISSLLERIEREAEEKGIRNICYTGGEPFLQPNDLLKVVVETLNNKGYHQEVFTNGSFLFPAWATEVLYVMMDWKLPGSEEAETNIEARWLNAQRLSTMDGIKFVVKDKADLDKAVEIGGFFKREQLKARIWVGSAWDQISSAEIVDYILDNRLGWSLNVQVHKYIWDPDERGV